MLELGEQRWSEREGELVNCDDDADEPKMQPVLARG